MKLRITEDNQEKIERALAAAQGRRTAAVIEFQDLENLIERVQEHPLLKFKARKQWQGTRYIYAAGGARSKTYKYLRKTTQVTLTRGARHWFLTGVATVAKWPKESETNILRTPL